MSVLISCLAVLRGIMRSRAALHIEVLALRHQLRVATFPTATAAPGANGPVAVDVAVTLVGQLANGRRDREARDRYRLASPGRPLVLDMEESPMQRATAVAPDARALMRAMSEHNPLWGAPRIHGELLTLGIDVSQATVARYMARRRRPPSQTWRTFLTNHVHQIVAADFFAVPTATCRLPLGKSVRSLAGEILTLSLWARGWRRAGREGRANRPDAEVS
jgi:hypothetical protein